LFVISWVSFLPDAEMVLRDFVARFDPEQGFGACNYGLIAIPEVDEAVRRAASTFDRTERGQLLKQACRAVAHECLLIPLTLQIECFACRGHLEIAGRQHMWTRPDQVVPRDAEMLLFDQLLAE